MLASQVYFLFWKFALGFSKRLRCPAPAFDSNDWLSSLLSTVICASILAVEHLLIHVFLSMACANTMTSCGAFVLVMG
jgi:hypothetical protein